MEWLLIGALIVAGLVWVVKITPDPDPDPDPVELVRGKETDAWHVAEEMEIQATAAETAEVRDACLAQSKRAEAEAKAWKRMLALGLKSDIKEGRYELPGRSTALHAETALAQRKAERLTAERRAAGVELEQLIAVAEAKTQEQTDES